MQIVVAEDLAAEAARRLHVAVGEAVEARGRCALALSGGRTPWEALRRMGALPVPWNRLDVLQVDEREAPLGASDRNLTGLAAALPGVARLRAMPVDRPDADRAYAALLAEVCGDPPVIDVVHLGLGDDGHTASLVPGDPALDATGSVAWTAPYQGRRRLTLTFPVLDRAGLVVWLVAGPTKRPMVERLLAGDATIPAGRVRAARQVLLCDRDAAP